MHRKSREEHCSEDGEKPIGSTILSKTSHHKHRKEATIHEKSIYTDPRTAAPNTAEIQLQLIPWKSKGKQGVTSGIIDP